MKKLSLAFVLGLVTLSCVVYSQTPDQQPSQQPPRQVVIDVVNVPVLVSVTDNKGKLITNLKREDFRIFEDEKVQTITDFKSRTDLPLSIALLVDSSQSVIDKLKFEQEAAIEFFFNTVQRKKDRATVIMFDSKARDLLPKGFTDQPEELADAVKKIKAGGGTAVYDAVYKAVSMRLASEDGDRRRLIILISDGDDTQSEYSLSEALEMAQKNDVTIYAVSTNRTSDLKRADQVRGDDVLKKMVEETGGKVYFPLKLQDLTSDFEKIGEELRSQYILYYTPTNGKMDGSYRRIKVEMADKKYKANARNGYYADAASKVSQK